MRAWTRSGEWPRKNTRFLVRLQAISHGWNHKSSGLRSVRCVMSETCITWLNASVHSEDLQAICLKEAIIMMERWKIGASVFYPSDLALSGYSCCPVVMKSGSIKKSPPFLQRMGIFLLNSWVDKFTLKNELSQTSWGFIFPTKSLLLSTACGTTVGH